MREPQLVRMPLVQKMSLCAIGIAVKAGRPRRGARRSSARRAAASAASGSTVMKLFRVGFSRRCASRKCAVISAAGKFPALERIADGVKGNVVHAGRILGVLAARYRFATR